MLLSLIEEELERRASLRNQVRLILQTACVFNSTALVRKGEVQALVAEVLGRKRSWQLAQVVIFELESMGVKAVCLDGYYFFRGVCFSDSN